MRFLIVAVLCFPLVAQQLSLSGPSRVRSGQPVSVVLTFAAGGTEISGFQFQTPTQPWVTPLGNKQMTCSATEQRCFLISETDNSALTSGKVGSSTWTPPSLPSTIDLSAIVATTPQGLAAALGPPPAITISQLGDVTGDGVLGDGDVQSALTQARDGPCTPSGDQNDDGQCNVIDVQIVVNEVCGPACTQ